MKCFDHRDKDAVGSCKACSKGLCAQCAIDVGMGLACRERCEAHVRTINEMIDRNIRMAPVGERLMGSQPRGALFLGVSSILAGVLFVVMGLDLRGVGRVGIASMGVLTVLFGLWQLGLWRRLSRTTGSTE